MGYIVQSNVPFLPMGRGVSYPATALNISVIMQQDAQKVINNLIIEMYIKEINRDATWNDANSLYFFTF